jgi:hypothetical protein
VRFPAPQRQPLCRQDANGFVVSAALAGAVSSVLSAESWLLVLSWLLAPASAPGSLRFLHLPFAGPTKPG